MRIGFSVRVHNILNRLGRNVIQACGIVGVGLSPAEMD
jgi:hypothetical protein